MASAADRLAKALYPHLIECGFRHRTLDEADWFTFVNSERPETNSAVTMACHALTWLCLTGRLGNMRMVCAMAVIAFLKVEKGYLPSKTALSQLKDLLDETPIVNDHVHEWFHRNYP